MLLIPKNPPNAMLKTNIKLQDIHVYKILLHVNLQAKRYEHNGGLRFALPSTVSEIDFGQTGPCASHACHIYNRAAGMALGDSKNGDFCVCVRVMCAREKGNGE